MQGFTNIDRDMQGFTNIGTIVQLLSDSLNPTSCHVLLNCSAIYLHSPFLLSCSQRKLDELKGSGFARIFGNELVYNRFQGIQSLTSGKTFNLLDFLIKLSRDHDYSFTQSLQVGRLPFPLEVSVLPCYLWK